MRWKVYVESGVALLLVEVGSLTAYGERVRISGLWEFMSDIVEAEDPTSISFGVAFRDERDSESFRIRPLDKSFWFEGGIEVIVSRCCFRAKMVEVVGSVAEIGFPRNVVVTVTVCSAGLPSDAFSVSICSGRVE